MDAHTISLLLLGASIGVALSALVAGWWVHRVRLDSELRMRVYRFANHQEQAGEQETAEPRTRKGVADP